MIDDIVQLKDVDVDVQASRRPQVIDALKAKYGQKNCLAIATFTTIKAKKALSIAAKGLGYNDDDAMFLQSLIPQHRGFTYSINDCLFGNKELDYDPVPELKRELNNYPGLLEVALKIEGSVINLGQHA